MTRNTLDASGRQHAGRMRPNHATASADTRWNRTMQRFDHSFA